MSESMPGGNSTGMSWRGSPQGNHIKIAIKVCFMVTPQPLSPLKNKKRIFVVEMDLPVTDMVPFIQHLLRRQVDQLRRIADLEQENA